MGRTFVSFLAITPDVRNKRQQTAAKRAIPRPPASAAGKSALLPAAFRRRPCDAEARPPPPAKPCQSSLRPKLPGHLFSFRGRVPYRTGFEAFLWVPTKRHGLFIPLRHFGVYSVLSFCYCAASPGSAFPLGLKNLPEPLQAAAMTQPPRLSTRRRGCWRDLATIRPAPHPLGFIVLGLQERNRRNLPIYHPTLVCTPPRPAQQTTPKPKPAHPPPQNRHPAWFSANHPMECPPLSLPRPWRGSPAALGRRRRSGPAAAKPHLR